MISKFISWLSSLFFYVVLDPTDNSVTLNKWLFRNMCKGLDKAKVFVFYIPSTKEYAFMLNPGFKQETQLNDVQYNPKYHCVGFESLNPTVNKIYYDYSLPSTRVKLSVARRRLVDGRKYYVILKPRHAKHTR